MTDGVSIDLGSILPYFEEKVRSLFGKDFEHAQANAILQRHLRIAAREAAAVQVVGMDRPVPIFDIYQSTRLVTSRRSDEVVDFAQVLRDGKSAIIFGGPGRGKTMLMKHLFAALSRSIGELPLLFILRWPRTAGDLSEFIQHLGAGRLPRKRSQRIVLLVDGLDEVPADERNLVSAALRHYAALNIGPFFVTCRSFYSPGDIIADQYDIAPFTREDCERFISAFARAYASDLHAPALIAELKERGLDDFISHPLMLALVCILKSGSMPTLPQTTLGLMRRALDVLTFRWDEAKGIYRESRINIDGDERVRIMMRVANRMRSLVEPDYVVRQIVDDHLRLIQRPEISAERLLIEMAQWYGVLVPTTDSQWTFVHRTLHDYLAARHWVESGTFTLDSIKQFDARVAYAACLTPDATNVLAAALARSTELNVFVECLANKAAFDSYVVATSLFAYFEAHADAYTIKRVGGDLEIVTSLDVLRYATDEFLKTVIALSLPGRKAVHEFMAFYAAAELSDRGPELLGQWRIALLNRAGNNALVIVERRGHRTILNLRA